MTTKLLLTHRRAMLLKYGAAGYAAIRAAIDRMIARDGAERDFTTRLIELDDPAAMAPFGGAIPEVPTPKDFKDAIDAVYGKTDPRPDYLVLLGASDVVPHQQLASPIAKANAAELPREALADREPIDSDLPYACDQAYNTEVSEFCAPSRVVGRIPDIKGSRKAEYLVDVLDRQAAWTSRSVDEFANFFGLSGDEWRAETAFSLREIFRTSSPFEVSPGAGPRWSPTKLARPLHFINCHGESEYPNFWGRSAADVSKIAHKAAYLDKQVLDGVIAAVECCFGGQLYDPSQFKPHQAGIANIYLGRGAYGYFGSTNTAYGPDDRPGDGGADRICQYFFERLLKGDSLGMAVLEARQRFAAASTVLHPVDQKTLAQFILLGDPSIHPVAAPAPSVSRQLLETALQTRAPLALDALQRQERRWQAYKSAKALRRWVPFSAAPGTAERTSEIEQALNRLAVGEKFEQQQIVSYAVEHHVENAEKVRKTSTVHVIMGVRRAAEGKPRRRIVLVVREREKTIVEVHRFRSK